ncbi:hypothetical protein [Chamaesiphon sp. OTE_8_metabat_110]|uniref:hypothetical protein n=1 Tax=Chamaesiphon sp. OTE_8_metabat_110 TaxID=2964696 RepID=UPI00286D1A0E|nr:hypothetical protein [Chamaesiphon sp. OTE_8_metabat_110]
MDEITKLIISRSTVESIGQQEIGSLTIGFAWRKDVWQKPHKIIQVLLLQVIAISISFTALMLPIDRVLAIYCPPQSQQARVVNLVWIDGAITAMILIGANRWMYRRGKQLHKLLKLIEQIEHYNQIVMEIDTLETLARIVNNCPVGVASQNENRVPASILEILAKTRHNLLIALQIESHSERLCQQPNSSELMLGISHNLIDLQNLASQPQLVEYGTLLTQAWEIGMSVYDETNL